MHFTDRPGIPSGGAIAFNFNIVNHGISNQRKSFKPNSLLKRKCNFHNSNIFIGHQFFFDDYFH